ncbi:sigma-54 interaction domain-containing protein [Ottowia thiooxydans]|uniref:Transcriptional regulator with PAS, ATPase and Fis domain n=1 Tax=Ottowia thiooxydans TaxID=219182 RepID=A0ABV2Q6W5_9BURK
MPFPEWFGSGQNEADFLRRVLDHVSDCLVAVDTAGRVVLINASYCRLLGGQAEDFIGRHVTEVVTHKTKLHLVAQGQAVGAVSPLEVRGHQLLARQVPVYQDDQIIGAVGVALFSDLESLKRAADVFAQDAAIIRNTQTPWTTSYRIGDIVGQGKIIEAVRTQIRQAASLNLPVVITGETGTGKELAANAIHELSPRAKRPFVWVNCASIPENLIDAELFGYEGGSFTGARSRGKPGKFELASGGTLFLDEIGDMPLHLQASLLRAVQNQEIVRVGGTSPVKVDVRVLCATNLPLEKMVRAGKFRADLYFRLNVLSVHMPSVREREDFDFLVDKLIERLHRRDGIPSRPLTPSMRERFRHFTWPGNVRQLEAALLRYLVSGDLSGLADEDNSPKTPDEPSLFSHSNMGLQEHLEQERKAFIARAIQATGGNKERAAEMLGISRATLYREIKR